jgi:choline dehydrogenase-like flavoprotein
MARSADNGVVDSDCRVFGIDNLYIVSGSVFPTSGHSNPTYTIVALAFRLYDTLFGRGESRDMLESGAGVRLSTSRRIPTVTAQDFPWPDRSAGSQ